MLQDIDAQVWSNILAFILLLVTGCYVFLTWRIANSNQRMLDRVEQQHREQTRPNVYAHLEFREQVVVRLVIENVGRSPAYNLRIRLSDDFFQFGETHRKNLKDLPIFNEEIDWFPPGARVAVELAQGFNFDVEKDGKNITPSRFSVDFAYSSKFESYAECCVIDLAPYVNMHVPRSVAEQLGKIEEHLRKIASR